MKARRWAVAGISLVLLSGLGAWATAVRDEHQIAIARFDPGPGQRVRIVFEGPDGRSREYEMHRDEEGKIWVGGASAGRYGRLEDHKNKNIKIWFGNESEIQSMPE